MVRIIEFHLLEHEYLLVLLAFYNSKLNILGFWSVEWTEQAVKD